ncbi:MAG: hypothetical protein EOO63_15965 [Hymenobacter sp.]|nr:MAG: hypothetical protein EOO63_15965 [Hymenobacter sp.]
MRYLLYFLFLLGAAGSAVAQNAPVTTQSDSLSVAQAAPDTAAAIHRLFAAKRHQSAFVISATVGTGLLSLLLAENTRHTYTIDATPIVATGVSLLSIPATAVEIAYYQQFTRRKERRALMACKAHKLPARIKHHLRPVYFEASSNR